LILTNLPAANVFHCLNGIKVIQRISEIEHYFAERDIPFRRIYFLNLSTIELDWLYQNNYQVKKEFGYVQNLENYVQQSQATLSCQLKPIRDTQQWQEKYKILHSNHLSPDGHELETKSFIALEKLKQEHGYMQCYLAYYQGKAIAMLSFAQEDKFVRIKNFVIHADYQNQGLGYAIIQESFKMLTTMGASHAGILGIEQQRLYPKLGMQKILTFYEAWKS